MDRFQLTQTKARRLVSVGAMLLCFLLLVGYVAAWRVAEGSFNKIYVFSDADSLKCDGTRTGIHGEDEDDISIPSLEIREGMECEVEFHVINTGSSKVKIKKAEFLVAGQGAGAGVRAVSLNPGINGTNREISSSGISAVYLLNDDLYDEKQTYRVRLEYQQSCNSEGAVIAVPSFVLLTLQRWGFEGGPGVSLVPLAFESPSTSPCK